MIKKNSFGIQFARNKVMDISFKGKRALVTGAGKGIVKKTPTISEFLMFVSVCQFCLLSCSLRGLHCSLSLV